MSNDGWGKLPTSDDNWGAPANGSTATNKTNEWPAPAVSDGWGKVDTSDWNTVIQTWPVIVPGAAAYEARVAAVDASWSQSALEGANNRAAVINSLRGTKDQYTIDQDGELSNIDETFAKPSDKETGVVRCYCVFDCYFCSVFTFKCIEMSS